MSFVDSHCHLDFSDFASDLEDIVARAKRENVTHMLTIGTKIDEIQALLEVVRRFSNIYGTIGLHPHACEKASLSLLDQTLSFYSTCPKIVGLGETGLDFFYDHSNRAHQEESFRLHIAAACKADLPLVVHTRLAESETIQILREEGRGGARGVIHCFTGTPWLAKQALDLGFYISLSGVITFKNAEDLRETVKSVPLDRLLIETDSPYLAPIPHRGRRNEPSFVKYTAEKIAEIKNIPLEQVASATTHNFFALFSRILEARL